MSKYANLLPYCQTDRQKEIFNSLVETNSQRLSAKALDIHRSSLRSCVEAVRGYAGKRLYAPEHGLTHPVQPNFTGDYTITYEADGTVGRTWIKGKLDKEKKAEQYVNFIEGLSAEIKPAKKKDYKKPKKTPSDKLASAIIIGDAHIGMMAHAVESGEDHNLQTAIEDLKLAIDYCVDCAPPSKQGWFINVGDFVHADSSRGETFAGTKVDVAASQYVVMRAAGELIRYSIDRMLQKFEEVIVVNARGNHDQDSAFALNLYIEALYEKEPRVTVNGNESKFTFIEFGKCLIGINHGDKINHSRLTGVMTKTQAQAWGRTSYRRWWLGHIHHKTKQETDHGVTIESFHTLAPLDAWHAASGYGAERRITMLTLHKDFGQVNEVNPNLDMIREAYNQAA
jgi:hypothetical protein|tara:strand:- start:843 stop:2033 length:1191 start_codon:yes stop_codon:yes gene_type:complete